MQQWIKEVARGKKGARNLTANEALAAAKAIVEGKATDAQLAAFLVAQRLKGETAEELLAFVDTLRKAAPTIKLPELLRTKLIDLAGPYNGRNTFAATVPVALLLADQGLPVLLHSSDALPPKKGTSVKTIVHRLGIQVDQSTSQIAHTLTGVNIGFAWTEKLCPPLQAVRRVREEIGVRTLLNTVEKILNLAQAQAVMVGVFHKTVVETNAAVLRAMGYKQAYIVQGAEGSEDLPVHRTSFVYEVGEEGIERFELDPAAYGLKHRKDNDKEKLSADQQVDIIRRLLKGEQSEELAYYRDQVLWNAGVRYYLFSHLPSIEEGIELARKQLAEGRGEKRLAIWQDQLAALQI
ncbi:anthranilate phosphoribosyltransferase [Caldalkalibacillus uzonensis]|uniref:Anthranilate phosphoribosyltransferase n=1 Tax=Caldalkalibacillus uzonensis TaxID=353224 RepID=A0ABU0CUI3_9BACI|nr:anthranilate phosphoribosyltransferase [Caldalkalibacillus uzonensis]MDQ0339989.1 anthranilate phosphoribosyltransferase [Caldalkalibacillus uzonensis]